MGEIVWLIVKVYLAILAIWFILACLGIIRQDDGE